MRPVIRPGLHVLRRDVRTLQLGLEWPGVAAVLDTPAVQAVLGAVDGFRDLDGVVLSAAASGVPEASARQALDILLDAGALVDQSVVRPTGVTPPSWSALWLLSGPRSTADVLQRSRQRATVSVTGSGQLADQVRDLLRDEGLAVTTTLREATVVVLASDREVSRDAADEALRGGQPFLCVCLRELVGLVGPFVVPGRTACLRCVDLSRSQLDPCWPTLVDSLQVSPTDVSSGPRSLLVVTAGYAAQEVAVWASGGMPVTCDHVVEIPYGIGPVQTVPYEPHPECGCWWQTEQGTMSA